MQVFLNHCSSEADTWWERQVELLDSLEDAQSLAKAAAAFESKSSVEYVITLLNWIAEFNDLIFRIRYYRRFGVDGNEILVGVCSAGHDEADSVAFRSGGIVKRREQSALDHADSFWCREKQKSIIFSLVGAAEETVVEQIGELGPFPLIGVRGDQCNNLLLKEVSDAWIDIPLWHAGEFVGKLSCDLVSIENAREKIALLHRFVDLVRYVTPHIEAFRVRQVRLVDNRISRFRAGLSQTNTRKQIYQYCVDELPQCFRNAACRVFEYSEDVFLSKKLVLKNSSIDSEQVHCEENSKDQGFHVVGSEKNTGIVSWAMESGKRLRLHQVKDSDCLHRQLESIHPELIGSALSEVDASYDSSLAQPLTLPCGSTIGALQLLSSDIEGGFRYEEEEFLKGLARDYIAERIATIIDKEVKDRFMRDDWIVGLRKFIGVFRRSMLLSRPAGLEEDLDSAMRLICPVNDGHSQRLYSLSVVKHKNAVQPPVFTSNIALEDNHRAFVTDEFVHWICKGLQGPSFITDFNSVNGPPQRHEPQLPLAATISVPLTYNEHASAVFTVGSARHDLSRDVDGQVLALVSKWSSQVSGCEINRKRATFI